MSTLPRTQWKPAALLITSQGTAMPTYSAVSAVSVFPAALFELLLLPFTVDDTRVQLKPMAGAEHDYINGNYIDVSIMYYHTEFILASTSKRYFFITHIPCKLLKFCVYLRTFRATIASVSTWQPKALCRTPWETSGGWSGT